jgi:hypothetical protein
LASLTDPLEPAAGHHRTPLERRVGSRGAGKEIDVGWGHHVAYGGHRDRRADDNSIPVMAQNVRR